MMRIFEVPQQSRGFTAILFQFWCGDERILGWQEIKRLASPGWSNDGMVVAHRRGEYWSIETSIFTGTGGQPAASIIGWDDHLPAWVRVMAEQLRMKGHSLYTPTQIEDHYDVTIIEKK